MAGQSKTFLNDSHSSVRKPGNDSGQITPNTNAKSFGIAVKAPGGKTLLKPNVSASLVSRAVDVCFVFDTTGSMSNKIDGLVHSMSTLVEKLDSFALDWRVTTVPFGDLTVPGDRIVTSNKFEKDVKNAVFQLRTMTRFSGGGNLGESSGEAMLEACNKNYRANAVKILILVTDEPALGSKQFLVSIDAAIKQLDAICFTVATDHDYYRRWAQNNGGKWSPISTSADTTSIIKLFETLLERAAVVANDVLRLGGGSVRKYLEIESGKNRRA